MAPSAPAPVTAALERKRRRESPLETLRGILIVMHASLIGLQDALKALTDLGSLYDGRITAKPVLQRAGGAELRACPLQILRHADQQRPAVGHRIVELLERDIEGGQRPFLDRAVLEAVQGVAQDLVRLGLHPVELLGGIAAARRRNHV